ncbi:GntR family transcriptional regulator [Paenibacillus xerothermodurans]|uniref:GntR family transcriptional regulator n=1 Tax=Paenibacillus xerothermodurans TaxID=1977292 RepID=A0A2W1NQS1_PAEXE|nr:GntR family transcriptional regulator [Paenibacillus xerothermodurans]PZE21213.1 GntR family transcriptional regulator [Paenibacillus xerothermodurans]
MSSQTEYAYQYIRERILDGTFKPMQKLIESQLSELISVSRNTVKKALLKLEQENLVQIENNKGATIKSFTLEEVKNYLAIREALEGLIARSAAEHITDGEIGELEQLLLRMEGFLKQNQFDEYSKLNKEFHGIIYNASRNIHATGMVNMIKTQLMRFHFRTLLIPGRNENSFNEHKMILTSLKSHNAAEAEAAIKLHIANVRKTIEDNYQYLL